ncbi:hypothetical protein [Streptomyces sp. CdTB01]|uniref:hypothetical protein n=1 Tax=Streptomyces sp. CdTB01 TaxID=1725411 RepID=UPI00073AB898|nr:hypothetical protein [Streptomyces sp. CdTB01]ALV36168.1 hypothetical protein AS200_32075 [Streptomyces sp. CdTB01]
MSDGGGYQVDPEALERITKGIDQAMDELKTQGFDVEANLGRGFDDLELDGLEVGDGSLRQVFADFCERWSWGVRSLMQDANDFACGLGLSAGLYHDQEQYVSGVLKNVWTAAAGNPNLTEEQARQRSWSQTVEDNNYSQAANADYSMGSFVEGDREVAAAWAQTEKDLDTSTVTPDALFDPRTEWQWGGPPPAGSESGEGEG